MGNTLQPAGLLFVRVDDRLLHGQVLLNWVRVLSPRRIAIVEDRGGAGRHWHDVLSAVLPPGVELWQGDLSAAIAALLAEPALWAAGTLLLLASPGLAVALHEAGLQFRALSLGCLGSGPGRRRVSAQVALSAVEMEALRYLATAGVMITLQAVPTEIPMGLADIERRYGASG
jgi:mannose/fructose/N-acetylgalactosamine-specific phosphotransferase system component IIB